MTITNGSTSTFSDYDEARDRRYALEAPVRIVSLPPELASEAGFDDCDRRFRE
jgi:hypothetical protein